MNLGDQPLEFGDTQAGRRPAAEIKRIKGEPSKTRQSVLRFQTERLKEPLAQTGHLLSRGHKITIVAPRFAERNVEVEAFNHIEIINPNPSLLTVISPKNKPIDPSLKTVKRSKNPAASLILPISCSL